jgi:hypothetical protein
MYGNQDDQHLFQQQDIPTRVFTPLGFNYKNNIDGSIATLVESCNLVNIHKIKHGEVPATHNTVSFQIDLAFISYGNIEFISMCGVLKFNTLFSSDHPTIFLDIDILCLIGYPVHDTVMFLERYYKINNPRLIEVYQASLIQQLINHNIASRIDSLYIVETCV